MAQRGRPPGIRPGKLVRRRTVVQDDVGDGGSEGADVQGEGERGNEIGKQLMTMENDGKCARQGGNEDDDGAELDAAGMDCDLNEFETGDTNNAASYAMVLATKDEEDGLVENALARVRHAQKFGKKNVRLSKREFEALERRRVQEGNLDRYQGGSEQEQRQSTAMARGTEKKTRKRRSETSNSQEDQRNTSHIPSNGEVHNTWGTATGIAGDHHHQALPDLPPSSSLSRRRSVRAPSNLPPWPQYPQQHVPGYYAYAPDLGPPPPLLCRTFPYAMACNAQCPYPGALAGLPPYPVGQPMFQYDPADFQGSPWGQDVAYSADTVPNSSSSNHVPQSHEIHRSNTPDSLYPRRG